MSQWTEYLLLCLVLCDIRRPPLSFFLVQMNDLVEQVVNLLLHLGHLVLLQVDCDLELFVVLLDALDCLVAQQVHCRQRQS